MSEAAKTPPVVPAKSADAKRPADAATPGGSPKVFNSPILPPSNSPKSPAPFGGHKGGKKTLSGFPVDSPEHACKRRLKSAAGSCV